MLTSKVDDDWLVGYLENNVMHQGLFPSSFVDIIVALKEQPNTEPAQVFFDTTYGRHSPVDFGINIK